MRTRTLRAPRGPRFALTRFFTALLATSLAIAWVPTALAATGDSASGSGTYGSTNVASFSFSATATGAAGEATGFMSWTGATGMGAITATVRCLNVAGNKAGVEGQVTASTAAHVPVGGLLAFSVTDNGLPGAGTDTFLPQFNGPPRCGITDFGGVPLITGDILVVEADADFDRVADGQDNCPTVANPNQADIDSDRIGDACDPVDNRDPDADGLNSTIDNCDSVANPDQKDVDADGLGDVCDPTDDRTAAQQLADLITQLQTGPAGPGNSYMAKLQGISDSVAEGDTKGACSKLNAFENEVHAQTGKKLTQSDADALLDESAAIKTKAGCS